MYQIFYICAILFASVASVVAMGSEKISFTWYLKHIPPHARRLPLRHPDHIHRVVPLLPLRKATFLGQ